jgi:hypothetical protein
MSLPFEFAVTDSVADFPVDALESVAGDVEILSALLEKVVSVFWFCLRMVVSILVEPMDNVRAGTEGDKL